MDITKYKIDEYETGVANLPDYPSEEGYTAVQLKAVFDARSDGELKEKHNGLIDALREKLQVLESHTEMMDNPHGVTAEQVDVDAEILVHNESEYSHSALFEAVGNALAGKVDKVAGKELSSNDFTDEEKGYLEFAAAISLDYVNNHESNFINPHKVTAEQTGAYTKEEIDEKIGDIETALDELLVIEEGYIGGESA